jgi:outer membrane protein OmpA-like peptidoglycan-associated protein
MKNQKARPAVAQFVGLVLLAIPVTARAVDVGIKVEPGVAIPLSSPQTQQFGVGGAGALKGLVGLGPYVDAAATIMFLGLPTSSSSLATESGRAWAGGGGVVLRLPRESEAMRLKRPHDREALFGAKPWVDGDALYVRTGPLDRFGVAVGAGVSFPLGEARSFWLGPFVRYLQIVGHSIGGGSDNRDAKILIIGLSLETGTSVSRSSPFVVRAIPGECPAIAKLPDRDNDGVPDMFDRCPDVPGPIENQGCPYYEKVVVKEEKIELRQTVQFAWNSAVIERPSYPALDEAAMALEDNKSFRVQIEGHASEEGPYEYNQTLSEKRAEAVLDYLVNHGVARNRLTAKGFSSSRPAESNVKETGREANRRVEFVVQFIILEKGSVQ